MDKSFFPYRPRMSKLLRETVAKQLQRQDFKFESEDFRARVTDYAEKHAKVSADKAA